MSAPNRRKTLSTALKAIFVIALLYFLAHRGLLSLEHTRHAFTQWEHVVPAFGAAGLAFLLGVARWQVLLKAQGIRLGFLRTFQLAFIGNFFNVALPGAVSGDFVKAFYIGREVEGQRARAFGSILFDRVSGLSALVLVSASALLVSFSQFEGTALLKGIQVFLVIAASGVVAFHGYLFLVRERHDPVLIALRALEGRLPKAGSITRIYEGLRHYHNHRAAVVIAGAISITIHLIIGWICLEFARALGETGITLQQIYIVVPLGLLVTAVPVMPGGIGTGHVAFTYFFGLLDSQRGADIFTLYVLTQFFYSALGGLVYLQFKARTPLPADPSPAMG